MFTFIETRLFTCLVGEYLSDDDYRNLQLALTTNPEAGPIISGSGCIRNFRWAAQPADRTGRLCRPLIATSLGRRQMERL